MSWWTDLRDKAEKVATLGFYDPEKSRNQEREQRKLINDQISSYKEQTNLARQQLNQTRESTNAENRRIQEKQIRSLRRTYKAQNAIGMLGQGQPAIPDIEQKLGG